MSRVIYLEQRQCPGDVVVMTGAVRDLAEQYPDYEIWVDTTAQDIWKGNPHVKMGKPSGAFESYYVDYDDIHNAGKSGRHFSQAFHISLSELLGVEVKQSEIYPDLHVSEKEQERLSLPTDGPFWVLNAGFKADFPLKNWGWGNYQTLVELLEDEITFVQVGEESPGHTHLPLDGAINWIGKTSMRDFIVLCSLADGSVGPVSVHSHVMAGFKKPSVVIAGGREPWRWEAYPNQRYLNTNGFLDCCKADGCWKNYLTLDQVPESRRERPDTDGKICTRAMDNNRAQCMEMITPEAVASTIELYYGGGVL